MPKPNDLSRSLTTLEQDSTLIVVIEMSLSSWVIAGIVPGVDRQPLKKLAADEQALLQVVHRWRNEAAQIGHAITRIVVAYEAGCDGFWLARWLRARDIETYVIHPTSVAVRREHRRAKTHRLDTELLKRAFLGRLRGEPDHCRMAAIPTIEEEDARRPNREHENLIWERTRIVNRMKATLARLGIRNFKPSLRKAPENIQALRTPEGTPLPSNTFAEMLRDMARLRFIKDQMKAIENERLHQLEQAPACRQNAMVTISMVRPCLGPVKLCRSRSNSTPSCVQRVSFELGFVVLKSRSNVLKKDGRARLFMPPVSSSAEVGAVHAPQFRAVSNRSRCNDVCSSAAPPADDEKQDGQGQQLENE